MLIIINSEEQKSNVLNLLPPFEIKISRRFVIVQQKKTDDTFNLIIDSE